MKFEEIICKKIEEACDFLDKLYSPRTMERDRQRLIKKLLKNYSESKE